MEATEVHVAGRVPSETFLVAAWILFLIGALSVAILSLLAWFGLGWFAPMEETVPALVDCSTAESIILLEDDSGSVVDLDPDALRAAAVELLVDRLAGQPCTDADLVTVVSFTENQTVTGPIPASSIGSIPRAQGTGTNIAAAVDTAVGVVTRHPDHRHVVVLLSDMEDESGIPLQFTLNRLAGLELIVVPIGEVAPTAGAAQVELRDSAAVATDLVETINASRQRR